MLEQPVKLSDKEAMEYVKITKFFDLYRGKD
jgi:hypothetical protein